MNKIFTITFILFMNFYNVLNASIIHVQGEFNEHTRKIFHSLVTESLPVINHTSIDLCDQTDYHESLKSIRTPLTRAKLMMFNEEDKAERFQFENAVNHVHTIVKTLNFEITGAEIFQGPRKQFLVAVIKPLMNNTTFTKEDIDDVLGEGCSHVTLMKAPLNDNETASEFNTYKNFINAYISSMSLKTITTHKTMAEVAHNQPIYRGR